MKIVTIIGARPQFIKASTVTRAIAKYNRGKAKKAQITEVILHTGQHYDEAMSSIFFRELEIPKPKYNLNIGSGTHGVQTGQMLAGIEKVLIKEKPNWVLVYGDTNSTLAGALAAAKIHIPIVHVEAGLRSFNRRMPEEINRIVADLLSSFLFCPSQVAVDNLAREGIIKNVFIVGDVMVDALCFASEKSARHARVLRKHKLQPDKYLLATIHRAENTDNRERLENIMKALSKIAKNETVVLPMHPRTRRLLGDRYTSLLTSSSSLKIIEPVGYFDIIALEKSARMILTDSGGIQKEAYWLKVPCATLRDETEWLETVDSGWNILTGANSAKIIKTVSAFKTPVKHPMLYGNGKAAEKCLKTLLEHKLT